MLEHSTVSSRVKVNLETGKESLSDYADLAEHEVFMRGPVDVTGAPFADDVAGVTVDDDADIARKKASPRKGDVINGDRFTLEYTTYAGAGHWHVTAVRPA